MFIGSREIKTVVKDKENEELVNVLFVDGAERQMALKTLNLITSEEAGEGDINDAVRFNFAKKILLDLADHELDFLDVQTVLQGAGNLAANMRDQACGMAFGVTSPLAIKVKDVFAVFENAADESDEEKESEPEDAQEEAPLDKETGGVDEEKD